MELRVGISGWTYPPWRGGAFYPPKWPREKELEYASRQVNTREINGTFYSLQRRGSFRAWHVAVPENFVFSVRRGRFITHLKRPWIEDTTSDFFYVRLHGGEELYVSGNSPSELKMWAKKIRTWARGSTPLRAPLAVRRPARRKSGGMFLSASITTSKSARHLMP